MISFKLMSMSFLLFSGGMGAKNPGFGYVQKKYFLHSLVKLAKIEKKALFDVSTFQKSLPKNGISLILQLLHMYFQIYPSVEWCHSVSTLSTLAVSPVHTQRKLFEIGFYDAKSIKTK